MILKIRRTPIFLILAGCFFTLSVSAQVPFREMDETRIKEIEKMLPEKPLAYGYSYKNREAWSKVIGAEANKWHTNYLSWETT